VVGATTMVFGIIMLLENMFGDVVTKLSIVQPEIILGLIIGAVVFVEWPEAGRPALPEPLVSVLLEHAGGDRRRIVVAADTAALLEEIV
jgi:tRNA A37 threonylcarbamoyladenosine biosynthesis protein TsaE